MELEEEHEGTLFDVCVDIWEQINKQPAVRYTAFKFLTKTAKTYPELSHEVILLAEDQYLDSFSSAVKKSIARMLKEIK